MKHFIIVTLSLYTVFKSKRLMDTYEGLPLRGFILLIFIVFMDYLTIMMLLGNTEFIQHLANLLGVSK